MKDSALKSARRVVVKIGSSLITNNGRGLDKVAISKIVNGLAFLRESGKEVVFVSSGAIAEGVLRLGWEKRPKKLSEQQAAAAVGQMGLAHAYEDCFSWHGLQTAQILLTRSDLSDRSRYLNARDTILELLALGIVPIINENDTVVTDEVKVGDNDTLGSMISNLVEADVFVILTDQRGLYTADPRSDPGAEFLEEVTAGDPELEKMAGGAASSLSRGGMMTKVLAAKRAARSGTSTIVAYGREPDVLKRLAQGERIGTQFNAAQESLHARAKWIADQISPSGALVLDAGASRAVVKNKTSLLPVGVREVKGEFMRGEVVSCLDMDGREIARGLVNYSSDEARIIRGCHTEDIARLLGYTRREEMIHRDDLVVLP